MNTEYLFLYGTLLADELPDEVVGALRSLQRVGPAYVHGRLYDFGEYPGAVLTPPSKTRIRGELFKLPATRATINTLDNYEEFDPSNLKDSLFFAVSQSALQNGSKVVCWSYLYNRRIRVARY